MTGSSGWKLKRLSKKWDGNNPKRLPGLWRPPGAVGRETWHKKRTQGRCLQRPACPQRDVHPGLEPQPEPAEVQRPLRDRQLFRHLFEAGPQECMRLKMDCGWRHSMQRSSRGSKKGGATVQVQTPKDAMFCLLKAEQSKTFSSDLTILIWIK